jgi:hypothetical protein
VKRVEESSAIAELSRYVFQTIWDGTANASNAISEALIEASSTPLYSKNHAAGNSAAPGLRSVPLNALNLFLARYAPSPKTEEVALIPVEQIVEEADAYLSLVPGGGALLCNLVAHIAQRTGYSKKGIRVVVRQNFQTNGELVWK